MFRLFWHQFKAGPWWRFFVMLPIFGTFFLNITDSQLGALTQPVIAAVIWWLVFLPDGDFVQAFGLTRQQARRTFMFGAVPAVLLTVVTALISRHDTIGVLGAALGILTVVAFFENALPNGEPKVRDGRGAGLRVWGNSLTLSLFWARPLLWAAGAGVLVGLLYPLGGYIGNETMRELVAAAPVIALWFALFQEAGLLPATARGLGLTRKVWAGQVVLVSLGTSAVFGLVAGSISLLIDAPLTPILTTTAITAFVCLASHAIMPSSEFFAMVVPFIFFFPTRLMLDVVDQGAIAEEGMAVIGLASVVLVLALVSMGLYLTGRVSLAPRSERFSAAVGAN